MGDMVRKDLAGKWIDNSTVSAACSVQGCNRNAGLEFYIGPLYSGSEMGYYLCPDIRKRIIYYV